MISDSQLQAACILHVKDGLVLAVERRDQPGQFGLPGGSIEPNEHPNLAAIRELREETGVYPMWMTEIYRGDCGGVSVITYMAKEIFGDLSQGDAGEVKFVPWQTLLDGPFGPYNQHIKNAWDKLNA